MIFLMDNGKLKIRSEKQKMKILLMEDERKISCDVLFSG